MASVNRVDRWAHTCARCCAAWGVTGSTTLLVEVLGTLRQGVFTPAVPRTTAQFSETFLIGSRPGLASLVLADGTVSRRHAEVTPGPDGWRIRDLGSDNGVFVLRRLPECTQPTALAGLEAEYVREAAVGLSLTVAVGAVVVRFTLLGHDGESALAR
jgi:hypothetical protein